MDVYTTEEEQLEKIKEWLKNYGPTILITLVIVLVVSFGWRYWQARETQIRASASVHYEQMLISYMNSDPRDAKLRAENLIKQYPGTPYAQYAAFLLAKEEVARKNYPKAIEQLQWVVDKASQDIFKQIARNRMARIYLAENKPNQALKTLQKVNEKSLKAVTLSIEGDAYKALADTAKAKAAYKQSLVAMPKNDANYALLQMKLNALG